MKENESKADTQEQIWFYMGRRESAQDRKLYAVWLDATQTERWFPVNKRTRGLFIGAAYRAQVVIDDDGVSLRGKPTWADANGNPAHKDAPTWKAIDEGIQTTRDAIAMEKKAAENDELSQALAVVRKAYQGTSARYRAGVLANFIQKVTR